MKSNLFLYNANLKQEIEQGDITLYKDHLSVRVIKEKADTQTINRWKSCLPVDFQLHSKGFVIVFSGGVCYENSTLSQLTNLNVNHSREFIISDEKCLRIKDSFAGSSYSWEVFYLLNPSLKVLSIDNRIVALTDGEKVYHFLFYLPEKSGYVVRVTDNPSGKMIQVEIMPNREFCFFTEINVIE